MASTSISEGLTDQLSALQKEQEYASRVASEADGARKVWAEAKIKRIKEQIAELEARRVDELGGQR